MVVTKGLRGAMRAVIAGAVALSCAAGAYAAPTAELPAQPAAVSYAAISDQDLTNIAARWDDLDAQQRRALLSEVKMRMQRNGSAEEVLRVKVRRRYGTVVRHRNGSTATLRFEVRSVQPGSKDFGVGFERRTQQGGEAEQEAESETPVIRVADPE